MLRRNTMTHEGWTNYETWIVNLFISNDREHYETVRGLARDMGREHGAVDGGHALASHLEEYFKERVPPLLPPFGDMLRSALANVEWREIGNAWVTDELEEMRLEASRG